MAITGRPALEVKTATVPSDVETKDAPVASDLTDVQVTSEAGEVTAIVSVTGVKDRVDDVIVPGAYTETLTTRNPKVCWSHMWDAPIGRVTEAAELPPGDPRLPKQTKDGQPWPTEAGGLLTKMQFNLGTQAGKDAFETVRFFSETGECEWSIGYRVPKGGATKRSDGVREIKKLDLFEVSVVLFGAAPNTTTLSLKTAAETMASRKAGAGGEAEFDPHVEMDDDELAALVAAAESGIDWDEVDQAADKVPPPAPSEGGAGGELTPVVPRTGDGKADDPDDQPVDEELEVEGKAVSDKPWSDFSASDYTPQQWHRACLIHQHEPGTPDDKSNCLAPWSPVLTRQGWRRADQVNAGDEVLTADMAWSPVTERHVRHFDGTIMGGGGTWITPDHPVLTSSGWLPMGAVDPAQDRIYVLGELPDREGFDHLLTEANQQVAALVREGRQLAISLHPIRPRVPVGTVRFKDGRQTWDPRVDDVPAHALLGDVVEPQRIQGGVQQGLDAGGALDRLGPNAVPSQAGSGAELLSPRERGNDLDGSVAFETFSCLAEDGPTLAEVRGVAGPGAVHPAAGPPGHREGLPATTADLLQPVVNTTGAPNQGVGAGGGAGLGGLPPAGVLGVQLGGEHLVADDAFDVDSLHGPLTVGYAGPVYNFEVRDHPSYFAGRLAVHNCKLPVREPGGAVNRNAVHAAAAALGGARGGVNASPKDKVSAAHKLISLYRQLGEDPPESLTGMTGKKKADLDGAADGGEQAQLPQFALEIDETTGRVKAAGVDTHPGAAERLRQYWEHGAGAAKIRWGEPNDWYRCVHELTKHMGSRAKGYCTLRHRAVLGVWPGQEGGKDAAAGGDELEGKARADAAPGGSTGSGVAPSTASPATGKPTGGSPGGYDSAHGVVRDVIGRFSVKPSGGGGGGKGGGRAKKAGAAKKQRASQLAARAAQTAADVKAQQEERGKRQKFDDDIAAAQAAEKERRAAADKQIAEAPDATTAKKLRDAEAQRRSQFDADIQARQDAEKKRRADFDEQHRRTAEAQRVATAQQAAATAAKKVDSSEETKDFPYLTGSYEEIRELLREAVTELFTSAGGADALEPDESDQGGEGDTSPAPPARLWVEVVGTYSDHCVVTVHDMTGPDGESDSYLIPYSLPADGSGITLGQPAPVTLTVVLEPGDTDEGNEAGADAGGADGQAADMPPNVLAGIDSAQATATLLARYLEGKAGRMLSSSNASQIQAAVQSLLKVLARAGIEIDTSTATKEAVPPPPPPEVAPVEPVTVSVSQLKAQALALYAEAQRHLDEVP